VAISQKVHHVGIPVSDIEASIDWYTNILGATDTGIRGGGGGEVLSEAVKVEGAEVAAAFLEMGDLILELIEYKTPKSKRGQISNNDVGALHLCFQVDDMSAAIEGLKGTGASLHHEPVPLDESAGDLAGYTFMYFTDPDGISIELFQVPEGGR
jgi:catechol 2,3-dioxygenase-like lactoylglutathione lyase family enzyme